MTNREIADLCATEVMGWTLEDSSDMVHRGEFWSDGENYICQTAEFNPDKSISDAFLVVEKMSNSIVFELTRERRGNYTATFYKEAYHDPIGSATADTAPLAISKAALKAVGVEV